MSLSLRRSTSALVLCSLIPCAAAQESAALFDAPVLQNLSTAPAFTELLDYDGDGDQDIVGLDSDVFATQVRLALYANDGAGRFTTFWSQTFPAGAQAARDLAPRLSVGDANDDGKADFAVATGHEIWTFLAQASGQAPFRTVHSEGAYVYDTVMVDLNGDGAHEVVGLTFANLVVLMNGVATRHAFGTTLWNPYKLELAEISGDAQLDFVVVGYREAYLYAWRNGAIQQYAVFWHELSAAYEQNTIDAGDIDGDGDVDLVAFEKRTSYEDARCRILRRVGPSHWQLEPIRPCAPASQLIDLDRDGALDIAGFFGSYVSGSTNFPNNAGFGVFFWAFNDGLGNFGPTNTLSAAGAQPLTGAADLDADGDVDLVGGTCVYYSRGSLRTAPAQRLGTTVPSRRELGDVDGDGDPDLGASLSGTLRNDLASGFTSAPLTVIGAAPGETLTGPGYPGDFDGDGDLDLLVRGSIPSLPIAWRFLRNHGGTFLVEGNAAAPGIELSIGSLQSTDSMVADVDGDGLLDLIALPNNSVPSSFQTVIWRQNPGAPPTFTVLHGLTDRRVIFAGRIDPDPLPDVVLTHLEPSGFPHAYDTVFTVRAGTGGGALGPERPLARAAFFNNAAVDPLPADYDGDGDIDLQLVSGTIHLNQSTAAGVVQFTPQFLTLLPGSPLYQGQLAVRSADVNGDTWPDLLMASDFYAGVDVALRIPGSAFGIASFSLATTQAFFIGTPIDFDADGDTDLLGYLAVRNTRFHGASAGLVRPYGESSAGTGGARPTLSTIGPVRAGSTAELRLVGARGGSVSFLALGTAEVSLPGIPAPGLTFYVGGGWGLFGPFPNQGPAGVPGAGSFRLPYLVDPSIAGVSLFEQVLVVDGGAPYAWVASNAVEVLHR